MKKHKYQWLLSALIILVALAVGTAIYKTQRPLGTTTVTPVTVRGHYRNWVQSYLRGGQQKYVVTATHHGQRQTLSEAQGYGMLITVMAAQQGLKTQRTFNQLTRYYLAHRISATTPLMAWRQNEKQGQLVSTTAEKTSATDGDLDIAYALILADERWHSRGSVNYGRLARQLIKAIYQNDFNPTTQLPRVGNWATAPGSQNLVRPSDLMTATFRKFASYTKDGRWTQVAQNSQQVLKKLSERQTTGLMADFVTVSGKRLRLGTVMPKQVSSSNDARYGFNACRLPWRTAYDYQLSQSHVSRVITQKMLRFFAQKTKITAGYTLSGRPLNGYTNEAFTAPVAYAAQVMGNQRLIHRYGGTLTGQLPTHDYYPATLQMLMLVSSATIGHTQS